MVKKITDDIDLCDVCGGIIGSTCTCDIESQQEKDSNPPVKDELKELFNKMKNRPTDEEIESIKLQYKNVFFTILDDETVYLYRPITSGEWAKIMAIQNITDIKRKQYIVEQCLIWPEVKTFVGSEAGTIPSLYEMVLIVSKFLSVDELLRMTRSL